MPSDKAAHYIGQCAELHATRKTFSGNGCLKYIEPLARMAAICAAKTALDYGCGKGLQYGKMFQHPWEEGETTLEGLRDWGIAKYDPGVPEFAARPVGVFDMVWATDVLECVPEADVGEIVDDLLQFADKALFVSVATGPSKKRLPNGENAHVTQRSARWWQAQFMPKVALRPNFQFGLVTT